MTIDRRLKHKLGFLVPAPRISTSLDAEMSGPRARVLGLITGFESFGWEVTPFIVGDRSPKKWSAKGSEAEIRHSFTRTLAVDITRLILSAINSWQSWQELGKRVDIVYEYAATLQCLGWIFQKQGIPWIMQAEALLYYEAKTERKALVLDGIARKIELWAYRQCDVLACVSATLKDILVNELNIPADKIILVPNGVDTDFLNPQLHSPKRLSTQFTIGFVGSLYSWAGIDLLLEVLSELKAENYQFFLTILGDGEMKTTWENLSAKLGLTDAVKFVGRVSGDLVPQYIAGFDLGYSGQIKLRLGEMYLSPMKLYEYMAMAKPVIASEFEDSRQLVTEEKTGFLFESGNKLDLKRALLKALSAKKRLAQMGLEARQEVVTNHTWSARVQALIEGSERILNLDKDIMKQRH